MRLNIVYAFLMVLVKNTDELVLFFQKKLNKNAIKWMKKRLYL
jgi:hypothetical protein